MDKDRLHHAYLLEGEREKIISEILELMRELRIETVGNPDYLELTLDSFKIDDARELRALYQNKSAGGGKKIFVISTNQFLVEAQNVLLKIFEDPVPDTHFFLIVPDASIILPTLTSRLLKISRKAEPELGEAEKFVALSARERIEFLKELLAEEDEVEDTPSLSSSRTKALKFLNSLESVLHAKKLSTNSLNTFNQIFNVREYLRQPGSSTKSLMESLALAIPEF